MRRIPLSTVVGSLLDRLLETLALLLFVVVRSSWLRTGLSGLVGRLVRMLGGIAGPAGRFVPLPGSAAGKLSDLRDRLREAALLVVLDPFGAPGAQAIGGGLPWQTILIATGGFGGIFYALAKRTDERDAPGEGGGSE